MCSRIVLKQKTFSSRIK